MEISKEELVVCIEKARKKLEDSIEGGAEYSYIYENSVELDRLIEIYIAMKMKILCRARMCGRQRSLGDFVRETSANDKRVFPFFTAELEKPFDSYVFP